MAFLYPAARLIYFLPRPLALPEDGDADDAPPAAPLALCRFARQRSSPSSNSSIVVPRIGSTRIIVTPGAEKAAVSGKARTRNCRRAEKRTERLDVEVARLVVEEEHLAVRDARLFVQRLEVLDLAAGVDLLPAGRRNEARSADSLASALLRALPTPKKRAR